MADERLRELERQWKSSSSVADEIAFLSERERAGELTRDRLCLAAYLGHAAAHELTGQDRFPRGEGLEAIARTVASRWGSTPLARIVLCLARLALPTWTERFPADLRPSNALDVTEDHLLCPCADHLEVMLVAARHAREAADAVYETHGREAFVALAASNAAQYPQGRGIEAVIGVSIRQLAGFLGDLWRRETVCGELVPWALGYSDPVAERVARRSRPT